MHHPGADRTNRLHPIRGVGWVGMVGMALFLMLAVGEILSPHGLRYEALRVIAERAPSQSGLATLVASTIAIIGMNMYVYISFGVIPLLYLLPAFWLAPRERTTVRFVVIPLWCVIESLVLYSPWSFLLASRTAGSMSLPYYEYAPCVVAMIGHAVLLWIATGRVRIAATFVTLMVVSIAWDIAAPWFRFPIDYGVIHSVSTRELTFQNAAFMALPWCFILVHGVMAFVMFRWAIRERRRACSTTACTQCGYSLEGIESNICPECGASAPSPVSRSEMGEGRVRAT